MIPAGMLFRGSFVSSAAVTTASNPMKAKKTIAAPENTPENPDGGRNGCQFAGWIAPIPSTMNRRMTKILIATMMALVFALRFVPWTSSTVRASTMITRRQVDDAPVDPGGCASASGRMIPSDPSSTTKYPDHPIATADMARPYSSTRSQPMIHAQISPRAV